MTVIQAKKWTAEEFEALAPDSGTLELDQGELIEVTPPSEQHGDIAAELAMRLRHFAKENHLGKVYVEAGYRLASNTVRGPDISFVRQDRLPVVQRGYRQGAPDLAIEILSPTDYEHPGKFLHKVGQYLEAGAQAVWVVDPRNRQVTIYAPGRFSETLTAQDTLQGEPLLPGFLCPLTDLFSEDF